MSKKEYMENWRKENKEKIKRQRQEYYQRTKEIQKQNAVRWQVNNPERFALTCKVNAANRKYPEKITIADLDFILERDGKTCYWCKKENLESNDLTLEHLQPFNRVECLTLACSKCNCARHHLYGHVATTEEKRERRLQRQRKWHHENKAHANKKSVDYHYAHKQELNRKSRERYYAKIRDKDV